jgi:hypothetical protein
MTQHEQHLIDAAELRAYQQGLQAMLTAIKRSPAYMFHRSVDARAMADGLAKVMERAAWERYSTATALVDEYINRLEEEA